jgi:hypothetical protein
VLDLEVERASGLIGAVELDGRDVREDDVHGGLVDKDEATLERVQEATACLVRARVAFGSRSTFIMINQNKSQYLDFCFRQNLNYVVKVPGTVIFLSRTIRQMRLTTSWYGPRSSLNFSILSPNFSLVFLHFFSNSNNFNSAEIISKIDRCSQFTR